VIRLWAESVSALYGAPDALPPPSRNIEKRYLDLQAIGYQFQREALPLSAIYLRGEREGARLARLVEPLSTAGALVALVANTYGSYLLDASMRALEFATLSRLVLDVPVRRMIASAGLGSLRETCEAILRDVTD